MSKRNKFLITSVLLSAGLAGIRFVPDSDRLVAIAILSLASIIFFLWSLWETLGRNATLLTLILPPMFTFGVGMFWFLLPSTLYAELPIVFLYGVGLYALISTANIFNISTIKSIALVRAAKGVGFVLTLFTSFLLYDAVLSLKTSIYTLVGGIFLISIPLLLQGLWVSNLDQKLNKELVEYAVVLAYAVGSVSLMLYFWPVTVIVGSLFLTVTMYVLLGLGQAKIEGRLFKSTLREYVFVGALVFIAMIFATSWRG